MAKKEERKKQNDIKHELMQYVQQLVGGGACRNLEIVWKLGKRKTTNLLLYMNQKQANRKCIKLGTKVHTFFPRLALPFERLSFITCGSSIVTSLAWQCVSICRATRQHHPSCSFSRVVLSSSLANSIRDGPLIVIC